LRSYDAAIRKIPRLVDIGHQQVISPARCNTIIEQQARVDSRAVLPKTETPIHTATGTTASKRPHATKRAQARPFCPRRALSCSRQQQGFKRRKRAREALSLHARITNLHHHSRTSVSATTRRRHQKQAFQAWAAVVVGVV
jgi:putative transposase